MIKIYPYQSLGRADYGWLSTRYHFSFANYYNPSRMGFGNLIVINDDVIQPGTGFATHPHRDMEIITYVTEGTISHKDSQGNEGRTEAGDVQIMTAGTGIRHSEYNHEAVETKLLQIWIKPVKTDLSPAWKTHQFPKNKTVDKLSLLVSGNGGAPLTINQDVRIFAGNLSQGTSIKHQIQGSAYIVSTEGNLLVDGKKLAKGDGAEITDISKVSLQAVTDSKLLLIEI